MTGLIIVASTKTRLMKNFAFLFIFSLTIYSCEKDKIYGDISDDSKLYSSLYSDSVDTLTIGTNKYFVETDLYRDFFPGGPIPRKSPLIASIYLVNCDSLSIPDNIKIKKLYVINNQTIWISDPLDNGQTNHPDYKLFGLSKNGPIWDTDISVDVILEIADNLLQKDYFVIAKDQSIKRVE
jgi:hypothetical protein